MSLHFSKSDEFSLIHDKNKSSNKVVFFKHHDKYKYKTPIIYKIPPRIIFTMPTRVLGLKHV